MSVSDALKLYGELSFAAREEIVATTDSQGDRGASRFSGKRRVSVT